jgi:hypothetical protein
MKIIVVISILIFPLFIFASGFGGFGYFSTGISAFNFDAFNSSLKAHGYEELSNNQFALGGGGYSVLFKHLLLGGEGYGCTVKKIDNDMNKGRIIMGYGYGSIGYAPIMTKNFMLAPIVGFGAYGITIHLIPQNIIGNFDDFLTNPARMSILSTVGIMTTIQGKAMFFIPVSKGEEQAGGILFGITSGYNIALTKGGWKMEDFDISESPKAYLGGFFVHVEVGGFGSRYFAY